MFTLVAVLAALITYLVPGLLLARGMYASAVKEMNSRPVQVIPPKPPRPRVRLEEMLHTSAPIKCGLLKRPSSTACTCAYRDDWIQTKNDWADYKEWNVQYGHVKNGVHEEPEIRMGPIYWSVPVWPLVAGGMFIRGGAKGIPNYREIERMENELNELTWKEIE